MTDEQIIKALDCCMKGNNCGGCCPYDDEDDTCEECTSKLAKDALDLIKRQQAEIESLKRLCESQEAEIMQNENRFPHFTEDTQVVTVSKKADGQYYADRVTTIQVDKIRTEAIKEFVERLKYRIFTVFGTRHYEVELTTDRFDRIAKELTEVKDDE